MRWILDLVFAEDGSQILNGDGTENFGPLRDFVLNLLKRDTSHGSLKGKRKRAAWSIDFLEKSCLTNILMRWLWLTLKKF